MVELAKKKCKPCENEDLPFESDRIFEISKDLGGDWIVVNEHHLEKEFNFKNFKDALQFTIQIGELAETEGHHPDIHLAWGRVRVIIWTHKINGLSENDFILAAKIDQINR